MKYRYNKVNGETIKVIKTKKKSDGVQDTNALDPKFTIYKAIGFDFLKDYEIPFVAGDKSEEVKNMFKYMKKDSAYLYEKLIHDLMVKIVEAKSIKDLHILNNMFLDGYTEYRRVFGKHVKSDQSKIGRIREFGREHPDQLSSTIFREACKSFIYSFVESLSEYEIMGLKAEINTNEDILRTVILDGVSFSTLEDVELKKFLKNLLVKKISGKLDPRTKSHLCFDCPVHMMDCPKMVDKEKKSIDMYPFITDGVQETHTEVIKGDDIVKEDVTVEVSDLLLVTGCKKFFAARAEKAKKRGM